MLTLVVGNGVFFAHSTARPDRSDWQRLSAHLEAVGAWAERLAAKFGAAKAGRLAGLAHDLGKYTLPFQARLEGGPAVDHATAGAREVMRAAEGNEASNLSRWMSELVAYAVAGHHAGLADRRGGTASLGHRLTETAIHDLDPVWQNEISLGSPGMRALKPHPDDRQGFQLAFLGRMLFSTLIDADRRDTEAHAVATGREAAKDRDWPALPDHVDAMIAALDAHVAGLARPGSDPRLNALRDRVLQAAKTRAGDNRDLFTLTVPTGGGKTLSVMRFALGHAARHRRTDANPRGIERIVIAIPFTTVTEQSAAILKGIFGDGFVLEHHSAMETEKDEKSVPDPGLDERLRLAMEDWAAPVVVTTNVQLFESLFSHRPRRCRKLHSLANSVIVLDEAQTIPRRLLLPCLAALDELVRNYGCTVVLCTATQPAVGRPLVAGGPGLKGGLELTPQREIAPDPAALHQELRRATIRIEPAPMTDDDLVVALGAVEQGFVIVNSRRHALALYRAAGRAGLGGLVHLTTRQCAAHRRRIVDGIRQALDPADPRPCRLVATSLIEAGIDLDFHAGWRAMAGLESVVQSAGRVNREGRRACEASTLTVFTPADEANKPSSDIAGLIGDFERTARTHSDLAHPDAVRDYFDEVYWREAAHLDVIEVEDDGGKARRRVLDCFKLSGSETDFEYRTVGENFRMIEERMLPVIVPWDERARAALARLDWRNVSAGRVERDLQTFIVQVPQRDRQRLIAGQHVQYRRPDLFGEQFPVLETDSLYDADVGLLWEGDAELGSERAII